MHQNTNEKFTIQLIFTCHHIYFTITPSQPKHSLSFRRKKICSCKKQFIYSYCNGGVKTSQTPAKTEKKQTANQSNFAQSIYPPNGNVKPEPDQSIFSQKTCSIIMLFYLHSNSNTLSNRKYFLPKILGNLWMHFLYSCKGLIFQDHGWSRAWLF